MSRVLVARAIRLLSELLLTGSIAAGALAQPANDNYSSPALFNAASNSVAGTIVGATREPGEDPRFGYSVWWRWIAPSNGVFTFVAEADRFRPFMLIAPSSTNLLVDSTNSAFFGTIAPNRFAAAFPINASLGTEYTLALFTYSNSPATGDYTLRVVASAPPVVSFIQPSAVRTRHIVGVPLELQANASDQDGQVARVDFFTGDKLLGSTSSPPYHVSASTAGAIADHDARLFVVAEDDAGLFGVGGSTVDGIRLIAFRQPPPPNDNFGARVTLSGETVKLEANNGGADREAGEPPSSGEQTLWWSWTAPATTSYCILARGLSMLACLGVFTGDTPATLNLVGSHENSECANPARVVLQAQAGQTYAISVGDSCETLGGPFTLHILPTTAPPQIADIRFLPAWVVAREPALEFCAVGMQGIGWTMESSTNLQQWQPCNGEFPFGWQNGLSDWADIFRAPIASDPGGSSQFYRLHGTR